MAWKLAGSDLNDLYLQGVAESLNTGIVSPQKQQEGHWTTHLRRGGPLPVCNYNPFRSAELTPRF